jgi:hypothetical protein
MSRPEVADWESFETLIMENIIFKGRGKTILMSIAREGITGHEITD